MNSWAYLDVSLHIAHIPWWHSRAQAAAVQPTPGLLLKQTPHVILAFLKNNIGNLKPVLWIRIRSDQHNFLPTTFLSGSGSLTISTKCTAKLSFFSKSQFFWFSYMYKTFDKIRIRIWIGIKMESQIRIAKKRCRSTTLSKTKRNGIKRSTKTLPYFYQLCLCCSLFVSYVDTGTRT